MTNIHQPRDTGGRFDAITHAESPTALLAPATGGPPIPASGMPVLGTAAAGYVDQLDEDGALVKQIRFNGVRPDDAPDGTAAVIIYGEHSTSEVHYRNGVLHDGSGQTPSRRHTTTSGMDVIERGYRDPRSSRFIGQDSPDGQPGRVIALAPEGEHLGTIETVWLAAGIRQDPAPGVPGLTIEMSDGAKRHMHFPFGEMSDLADGTPAERYWDKDGHLTQEGRYYGGFLADGDDGTPAIRQYWGNGTLALEKRYCSSRPRPGANGEPAVVRYNEDGTVASTEANVRGRYRTFEIPLKDTVEDPRGTRAEDHPYARMDPAQRS